MAFASRHSISRSKLYAEIKAGRLIARKVGDRTVILAEDGRAWRENLPKVEADLVNELEPRDTERSAAPPTDYNTDAEAPAQPVEETPWTSGLRRERDSPRALRD